MGARFYSYSAISARKRIKSYLDLPFDNKALKAVTQAERAIYADNHWQLQNVEKSAISDNQIEQTKGCADQAWQTTITPSKLGIMFHLNLNRFLFQVYRITLVS